MTQAAKNLSVATLVVQKTIIAVAVLTGVTLALWQIAGITRGGASAAWWMTGFLTIGLAMAIHWLVRAQRSALLPDRRTVPGVRALSRDLGSDIRRGIAHGEFAPYYQPMVDLRSGLIVGFECLARWRHPDRGLVMPSQFIALVENVGLIDEFSNSLLARACRDAVSWPRHLTLSFNVSPVQLSGRAPARRWLRIAHDEGLDPHRLIIEVTERQAIHNVDLARNTLATLQRAGVQIMLDDLGAGFAARHLCEIGFNAIKLDRELVQRAHALESGNVVDAILSWSEARGLPVVAEGIEIPDHARALRALGCDTGQGYLFSEPVPASDARQLAWAAA